MSGKPKARGGGRRRTTNKRKQQEAADVDNNGDNGKSNVSEKVDADNNGSKKKVTAAKASKKSAAEEDANFSCAGCLLPSSKKANSNMKSSLQDLHLSLLCPLCGHLMREASTLGCAHSFCKICIDQYCCNNWTCPVPGCSFPVSMRFRAVNPSLQSVITSFQTICNALEQAPDEWWLEGQSVLTNEAGTSAEEEQAAF